jgi:hypothetical protein
MHFIIVYWSKIDSASPNQYIGPFLAEKDALEWGHQIIGEPEGTPWSVEDLDSSASCVKQFKHP